MLTTDLLGGSQGQSLVKVAWANRGEFVYLPGDSKCKCTKF
jgi:hypothetical protein